MNPRHEEAATDFAVNWLRANGSSIPDEHKYAKYHELRQQYLAYVRKGYVPDDYYDAPFLKRVGRWFARVYYQIRFWFRRRRK